MGTGSGILSQTAEKAGIPKQNIITADIGPEAVNHVKKQGFKTIHSDLFENISQSFDIITFNAPYLQKHKHDSQQDTTGGKHGDEIALKFLKQAKKHLNPEGKILLLISSHTPQTEIEKFNHKIIKTKKLFFEELKILQLF